MKSANVNDNDFSGGEMAALQTTRDVAAVPGHETYISVLRQLVTASKDAEPLVACYFELHFITAAPLMLIYDKFAWAITMAQRWLQRHDQASTPRVIDRESQGGES